MKISERDEINELIAEWRQFGLDAVEANPHEGLFVGTTIANCIDDLTDLVNGFEKTEG